MMCALSESYVTGPASIGGAARMWGRLLVVWILGAVPEAGMKSGEIRSDYLINRLRLQEVAIRTSSKVESRKD